MLVEGGCVGADAILVFADFDEIANFHLFGEDELEIADNGSPVNLSLTGLHGLGNK